MRSRAVLATLSLPIAAVAAVKDFAPGHTGWNGLSELCDLARGMGLTVEATGTIDVDGLAPDVSTLLILSPRTAPDPAPLLRFLRRGGRALLADDFGRSAPLMAALDLDRAATPAVPPSELYRDNPNLPIARPASLGPLTEGVDAVVTNHPAVLRSRLPAVLWLSSPLDAIAVAGEVPARDEPGRFVALSDPSLLINNMLAFEGNVAFARNLLTWLGRPGGHVVVLAGEVELRGGRDPAARARPSLGELRREFNKFCAGLSWPPPRRLLLALGVLLCLGLVAGLVPALRLPRRPPPGPFATRDRARR